MTENETKQAKNRAVLVGLWAHRLTEEENATEETEEELADLLETAGGECAGTVLQSKDSPDPRTFIGEGKVAEVRELVRAMDADMVIFDNSLSPSQQRVLSEELGVQVLDRAALILDIFAQRARTREGRLQVELAQYQYLLPRLLGMWTHLERQEGAIGTRGPGETHLETDRRHIRRKIQTLREELELVRRVRATQRTRREKNEVPVVAIVGYTNAGKSTLFNALTKAQNAQAANYPFCTIEPNKATVPVPDRRIDALVDLVHPQKTINATVDFIDIAGLVRGASKGEGLGNQFLGNIRECAAILEVVRCFEDDDITHVDGSVDPLRDIETNATELLLADIQGTSKRHERMVKMSKGDKDARVAADEMARLLEHLNNGNPASTFEAKDCPAFAAAWHELGLLTAKKIIYCANVDEDSLAEDNAHVTRLREFAATRNIEVVKICARIEEELQGLSDEEQREMLGAYGIEESGLLRVIHSGYKALGLASYFTAGEKEVRAWTIQDGWKAPQAAGVIHTDFERGFIRAEVIGFDDYVQYKTEAACRTAGVLRTEGKEYVVKDGDVMHFLFNV